MNYKIVKFPLFDGNEIGLFIDKDSFEEYISMHGIDGPCSDDDYFGCVLEPHGS